MLVQTWFNYSIQKTNDQFDTLIFDKYIEELSDESKCLKDSTEYSLYFDVFEDPERNKAAWVYFISCKPSSRFLKIMLVNSGPVPYELKHQLYEQLISNKDFHADIYRSIRHSCFDNCGDVDINKALKVFQSLKLENKINELNKERGHLKYNEIEEYLKGLQ